MKTLLASAAIVTGLLVAGGCIVEEEHHHHDHDRVVYVEGQPEPGPLHEEITVRPRAEAVWVPGHWVRDRGYWVWEHGHWE